MQYFIFIFKKIEGNYHFSTFYTYTSLSTYKQKWNCLNTTNLYVERSIRPCIEVIPSFSCPLLMKNKSRSSFVLHNSGFHIGESKYLYIKEMHDKKATSLFIRSRLPFFIDYAVLLFYSTISK